MKTERKLKLVIAIFVILMIGGLVTFVVAPWFPDAKPSLIGFGVSLMTAGTIALVLDRVSFTSLVAEVGDKLDFALEELEIRRKGVRRIVFGLFYDEVYEKLRRSKVFNIVQTWSPDLTNLLIESEDVIRRGGKVRVYLLHPKSLSNNRYFTAF